MVFVGVIVRIGLVLVDDVSVSPNSNGMPGAAFVQKLLDWTAQGTLWAGLIAILQPEGGFLVPERCIVAHVETAQRAGADIHARERVLGWETVADGVRVPSDTSWHGVSLRVARGDLAPGEREYDGLAIAAL